MAAYAETSTGAFDESKVAKDLSDADPINPSEVYQHGVVFSVPLIYINADESITVDKVISNLRVMNKNSLTELTKIASDISCADKSGQLLICDQFVTRLSSSQDGEYGKFIEFLKWGGQIAKDLDVDEEYVDSSSMGITFDLIRNYIVDSNTNVLISAEPIAIDGIQLYSQLGGNRDAIQSIREATNDTDLNRIQFCLAHFEKQLTFSPGYVLNQTIKIINLAFFFMCLYSESSPVLGYSSNDLKGNILAYIVDVVVRSRVMQAWQRDNNTKILLSDLSKNYDNRHNIIKLSQLTSARERAQFFLNLIKNKGEVAKVIDQNFYNRYISVLEKFKLSIDGCDYYLLGASFIAELGTILPDNILNIQELCQKINIDD